MREYKGIELENLDKKVAMAHSRFLEQNVGTDYLAELLSMEKSILTVEQFEAMSALNSVANMNYQICGLDQYYFNGYDRERTPFNADDVKQLDKNAQVRMLHELQAFGLTVFPEKELENERLDRIIAEFDEAFYEEPTWSWDDEEDCDEYDDGLCVAYGFDERYYKVNDYLEAVIEAYAQYLIKSFAK